MNDPEVAILVMLDEPTGKDYYGGTIAAPVGGQIFAEILPYLGFEPQYSEDELSKMAVKIPSVAGLSLETAKKTITDKGLKYQVVGNGDSVIKQFPTSTESLYSDGIVMLYTDDSVATKTNVPSFVGLSISAANELAANKKVNIQFAGTSLSGNSVVAYKQDVEEGAEVDVGTIITVYFRTTETAE